MTQYKGLRAEIIRGRFSSANGGISDHAQQVTVVGEGIDEVFEASEEAPAVRLVTRAVLGKTVYHFEPVARGGEVGPMASGSYVSLMDSRLSRLVPFYGAVALHDRFETAEQYRALSI